MKAVKRQMERITDRIKMAYLQTDRNCRSSRSAVFRLRHPTRGPLLALIVMCAFFNASSASTPRQALLEEADKILPWMIEVRRYSNAAELPLEEEEFAILNDGSVSLL